MQYSGANPRTNAGSYARTNARAYARANACTDPVTNAGAYACSNARAYARANACIQHQHSDKHHSPGRIYHDPWHNDRDKHHYESFLCGVQHVPHQPRNRRGGRISVDGCNS